LLALPGFIYLSIYFRFNEFICFNLYFKANVSILFFFLYSFIHMCIQEKGRTSSAWKQGGLGGERGVGGQEGEMAV
jgi:hypothetical protein